MIRVVRLRAESVWPALTGARILPPSGGGCSWWGASLWCVKRLLVAVSMAVECRGWRQSLPCPLASRRLGRAGAGWPTGPESALGPVELVGWSTTTGTCLFACVRWETSRSRFSSFGRALARGLRPSLLKIVAQCSLLAGVQYR